MRRWELFLPVILIVLAGCSTVNEYGTGEFHWGGYGNAWRCDPMYINKPADFGNGVLNDTTDLLFKPIEFTLNTVTFRFVWGTNGVVNYFLGLFSVIPGYTNCDAAFWYDWGVKSLDTDDEGSEDSEDTE